MLCQYIVVPHFQIKLDKNKTTYELAIYNQKIFSILCSITYVVSVFGTF
jgi:hypothetical protein